VSTLAIVGSPASATNLELAAGWRALGLPTACLSGAEARARLGPDDVAVGRIDVLPTVDGTEPGLLDLLLLERAGVPVLNPTRSLLDVHDKLRTARRLEAAALPHPRTGWVRSPEDALPVTPPVVIKPRFGSWGRDVFRCRSEREASTLLRSLADRAWFRRHGALIQELVPSRGRDLRLLVAGGRVVGAVERRAAPGDWRTNVSLGGSLTPAAPDAAARALAIAAAAAVAGDLVGVDLLPLAGGEWLAVELNGAVDFDVTYSLAGRDVYRDSAAALGLRPRGRAAAA